MDEASWKSLCHQAWIEDNPVKLLKLTMQITQLLAQKQQQLDAEYDERERKGV
jgi:hypothetical protein